MDTADLIAVEPNGRIAVIEIKLAHNAEARRAVVAQVLAYAAYLWNLDPAALERDVLAQHLRKRGYQSISQAVASNDQEQSFDADDFATSLAENLAQGYFRLILVLDEAPEELVQLVGYLQAMSEHLIIDLITMASYTMSGSQFLVPQRVEAERQRAEATPSLTRSKAEGDLVGGAEDFIAGIDSAPEASRPLLHQLSRWAAALEKAGLVKLSTYHGKNGVLTLLPRIFIDNVGLVSIYNNNGQAYLQFWRSVFERRAPKSLERIEQSFTPIKQGNIIRKISDELLDALTAAYQEAAAGEIET